MSYIEEALDELERPEYKEDSRRIQRVAAEHGTILTLRQAEKAWLLYSNIHAAGWVTLPKDDYELWHIIS